MKFLKSSTAGATDDMWTLVTVVYLSDDIHNALLSRILCYHLFLVYQQIYTNIFCPLPILHLSIHLLF